MKSHNRYVLTLSFILLLILLVCPFGTATASESNAIAVQVGKAVYNNIVESYKGTGLRPVVWGWLVEPKIVLWIPEKEWDGLSEYDRNTLAQYAKSLVPLARSSPDDYIDIPRSAPLYNKIRSNIARLCDKCWAIGIGHFEASEREMLLDRIIMEGKP